MDAFCCFGPLFISIGTVGMFLWVDMSTAHLRVDVLLADQSLENPNYIGQWQIFLPSDVCLGCMLEL